MRLDGTWPIPSVSRLDLSALPIDVSDFQAIMCGALARDAAEVSTAGRAFSEGVSKVKVNMYIRYIAGVLRLQYSAIFTFSSGKTTMKRTTHQW